MAQAPDQEFTRMQTIGLYLFIFLCGVPALELNGFGFGMPLTLQTALICATAGGAIGGMMMCSRPVVAGLLGGLLAGPGGLLAVYYYTQHRQQVWNVELVLIQGLGCLPGIGLGVLIRTIAGSLWSQETSDVVVDEV